MTSAAEDRWFMASALRLSRLHTGQTGTNPSVGCVVVKDGEIVGSAVTAPGGRPHAETQALEIAGEKARGATVYVTLEPCSHYGRTPPCANALVEAGVARVVISLTDPDPRVSGRGIAILRDAGIVVETGLMEEEGRRALAAYLTRQTKGRPHVTLKLAVSADGMLGRRGEEVSITGADARAEVHRLRAETDAILVGIGTALSDDPELTVRIPGLEKRSPIRIVLDRWLELPLTSKLVETARDVPVIVVAQPGLTSQVDSGAAPPSALPGISPSRGEIDQRHAHPSHSTLDIGAAEESAGVVQVAGSLPISPLEGEMPGRAEGGDLAPRLVGDLASKVAALQAASVEIMDATELDILLAILAVRGISSLLVEGGASVARAFLEADLVDRVLLFQGTGIVGEGGLESPVAPSDMPAGFKFVREESFGPDRCFEYERGF
ncbi:bifunctional diaminohydroxyphosphoribosylaminopyrimidine deaminase/5-amino-6-(5-phosphoribosylamino)uracil reductase RibD [Neorhizobium galegae]|uniref:bifunctional diaminohydroxyphosphoribosylaminopyrimidine deaminase/5-amino-6-(5-phosphoribosylamino)uracil reductase RibD n=1 Tax=Neorhizobium galegae TaxID=399 RepID=UPI000622365C|nr:bifunctional diaminohydroxyphosphoribosylaminopyrimidine deaminase/5-amino-6-(5-phosphoribosylamino)uracil reductase RibD [Neorhizobium galegae]CDZ27621.1 Riboflavin biosynthesis protein RibD [Neorhizobium galegae bv. officinalis]KAA9386618.1 bifunctional diaminohydroxyphosphoribosylaminopyrimidine deaminase/5-amino-6-(5-phosphoribosylamino)uracil reductase RibD [Neorhizobium galegae]KAB1110986.1 bifunctional diaminohydroxyphosphoribosylaminopyrimidine deaminase/5-amino-6-(5-phosphoribosylami